MAWDRGFYYRSERAGQRVCRTYLGRGHAAEVVSQLDAAKRQEREAERAARLAEQAEMESFDDLLDELDDRADRLAHAALLAAGFHQHKRQWRKCRGLSNPGGEAGQEV